MEQAIPRPHQVCNSEEGPKEDTKTTNNHVGNAHERIFATHHRSSRDKDLLRATILGHWEIYIDLAAASGMKPVKTYGA